MVGLMNYEREVKEMDFVMLEENRDLLVSIEQSLLNKESILLCGRSGNARKTIAHFLSFMMNYSFMTPAITKDYSIREFKKELKTILELIAQNQNIMLFVEDYQIVSSEILELLNNIVSGAEISGLVSQEELEGWLGPAGVEEIRRENYGKTIYECFQTRIKTNIRIVMSFDHANSEFSKNCASNPGFFNNCAILWNIEVQKKSVQQLGKYLLKEQIDQDINNGDNIQQIINSSYDIFKVSQQKLGMKVSFRQYHALLKCYLLIYKQKIGSQGAQNQHLKLGLNKLKEAESQVNQLQVEADQKRKELSKKQAEADLAMKEISKAMENAATRKSETEYMQSQLIQEEKVIQESKKQIEYELSDIMPEVERAQKAVGAITKANINEIKSLMMPVETIHDILSAVLRIFGNQDTSWNSMKKFIAQKGIIEQIINFDPRTLNSDMRKNLHGFIQQKRNSFDKQTAYRASQAAGPMAEWVVTILKLSVVLEKIAPLENKQKKIENNLQLSRMKCNDNEKQLEILDRQVNEFKQNFEQKTTEAAKLKQELHITEQTLQNASSLLKKLSGEKDRWNNQLKQSLMEQKMMPSNCMLCSSFVVFLSQEDEEKRAKLMDDYKAILKNNDFEFLKFMVSENQILKYKSEGLPGDNLSLQNSGALFNSYQIPLIIDPNYQATKWLTTNLQSCEQLIQFDNKYNNSIELAIRFGKTLLVKELNCIDGLLVPILKNDLIKQGPRNSIHVGDKLIDYNQEFRIFLATRNQNIELPFHNKCLVNTINFTVTKSGLENKLLSLVIDYEQPELEQKKSKLVQEEENLKMQLNELEVDLLQKLAESKGNILENKELIESLEQTKDKSSQIQQSLQESNKLQISLDEQRNVYRPLASQGALMFLLLNDMNKLNNMYRFSQRQFVQIFKKSLQIEYTLEDQKKKMEFAISNMYRNTVNSIGGALFKQDRLILGLHLLNGLKPYLFQKNEYEYMLGFMIPIKSSVQVPSFVEEDRKEAFQNLVGTFQNLAHVNWDSLAQLFSSSSSNSSNNGALLNQFPTQLKQQLTAFQRLLIIQTLKPDQLNISLQQFVIENLNLVSITGINFSFSQIYTEQSSNLNPILFLVSAGSDPSKELEEYGNQMIGNNRIKQLSMGGGQDQIALEMLNDCAQNGYWLIFKNLHLVTPFLNVLEKQLRIIGTNCHNDFRLWLTSEPHPHFPSILLESCIKFSYESPPGIKKNLLRVQQNNQQTTNMSNNEQQQQYNTLQMALNWLHALVQERRTYIPQGWSKFYEFSYSDLKSGQMIIEEQFRLHKNTNKFQWETIHGLFKDAIYGGRIDNEFDLNVLATYLKQFFNNQTCNGQLKLTKSTILPQLNSSKDILTFINKLPDNDSPQMFGLPNNIEKAVQRYIIQQMIDGLVILKRVNTQNMSFDRSKWQQQLGPLIQAFKNNSNTLDLKNKINNGMSSDSILSFIENQIEGTVETLKKIENSMRSWEAVLQGTGLLSPLIYQQGLQVMKGEVPKEWSSFWEGPENPAQWLQQLMNKAKQLNNWLTKAQNNQLLQTQLNLNELFHPEIFLNCVRQMSARQLQQSIDNLRLESSFEKTSVQSQMIINVTGLYIQGASVSNGIITDMQQNQSTEFQQLQNLYLAWVPISSLDFQFQDDSEKNDFPLFTNPDRSQLLCKLNLKVQDKRQRILAGTALFLSSQ